MGRFFSYSEIVLGVPAPAPDILRITGQITDLSAFAERLAVLSGSAAWGDVTWRSDIDIMAYSCDRTAGLEEQIEAIRKTYVESSSHRHRAPHVDITLVGAEHEELVERDNLVSGSAAILEPRVVSEIFDRVCVRLMDHVSTLAVMKGEPWRSFAERYVSRSAADSGLRRDVMREYCSSVSARWRQFAWDLDGSDLELNDEELAQLGFAEGFASHIARLVLGDLGAYPRPDRRADVRRALDALDGPWGMELRSVSQPYFDLGIRYESLVAAIRAGTNALSESEFNVGLREAARAIDVAAVEELMWRYLAAPPYTD
jgi:predicted nucleotidyltransferase